MNIDLIKLGHYVLEVHGEPVRGILFISGDSNADDTAEYWISPLILAAPLESDLTDEDQTPQDRQLCDLPELIADFRTGSYIRCPKSVKKVPLFVVHTRHFNEMLITFRKGQTNMYRISSCYRDGVNDLQAVELGDFPFSHCFSVIERNADQNRRQARANWVKTLTPQTPFELFLEEQFQIYSLNESLASQFYESLSSSKGVAPLCFHIENVFSTQFYSFVQCAIDANQKCSISTSGKGRRTHVLLNDTFRTDCFRTGCSIFIDFNDLEVLKPILGSSFYYFPLETSGNEHSTASFRYATIPVSGGDLKFEFNLAKRDLKVRGKVVSLSHDEIRENDHAFSDQVTQFSSFLHNKNIKDISTGKFMSIIMIETNHDLFTSEIKANKNGKKIKSNCSIVVAWGIDVNNPIFNDDDSDRIIPSLIKCAQHRRIHCIPYDPSSIVKKDNEFTVKGNLSDRLKPKCKTMARSVSKDNKQHQSRKRRTRDESDDEISWCTVKKDRTLVDQFTAVHRLAVLHYFRNLSPEVDGIMDLDALQNSKISVLTDDDPFAAYVLQQIWKAALKCTTVTEFSMWIRHSLTNWLGYSNFRIICTIEKSMMIPLHTSSAVGDGKKLTREALADFLVPQIMDHIFNEDVSNL